MITIKVTEFQAEALGIYIFDPAHDEDEFPGTLTGNRLVVTDAEWARELLTQAANSAGNDRDARMEVAILAVCRRLPSTRTGLSAVQRGRKVPQRLIAEKHNISQTVISWIKSGKVYKYEW